MITLAIDTSAGITLGLATDGRPLAADFLADPRAQVEQLHQRISNLLDRNGFSVRDIDQVVVGMGPGPFTGLRVGIAAGENLAYALGAELTRVNSLDALALTVQVAEPDLAEFVTIIDARRHEYYWAAYDQQIPVSSTTGPPHLSAAEHVPQLARYGPVAAPGQQVQIGQEMRIDGALLAAQVAQLRPVGPEPLYLRAPDASISTQRKSALVKPRSTRLSRAVVRPDHGQDHG